MKEKKGTNHLICLYQYLWKKLQVALGLSFSKMLSELTQVSLLNSMYLVKMSLTFCITVVKIKWKLSSKQRKLYNEFWYHHIKGILMIVLPWLLTYTLEIFIFYSVQGDDLWLIIDGDCGLRKSVLGGCVVRSIAISTEKKILLILFWLNNTFSTVLTYSRNVGH